MKPDREMKIIIHPPRSGGPGRWHVWASDHFHFSDYDHRIPAREMADMIQRTLYEFLP